MKKQDNKSSLPWLLPLWCVCLISLFIIPVTYIDGFLGDFIFMVLLFSLFIIPYLISGQKFRYTKISPRMMGFLAFIVMVIITIMAGLLYMEIHT